MDVGLQTYIHTSSYIQHHLAGLSAVMMPGGSYDGCVYILMVPQFYDGSSGGGHHLFTPRLFSGFQQCEGSKRFLRLPTAGDWLDGPGYVRYQ